MTRLSAALAATALAPLRWFEPWAIAGGWSGRVAGAAADPFPQLSQLRGQGGELAAQLLDLLLLGLKLSLLNQDEGSDGRRSCQPVRFCNPSRSCAHHRRSLPVMQPGIKLPSRVQQGSSSMRAVPTPERVQKSYAFMGRDARRELQACNAA
jgi:hypothetical protein